MTRTVLCRKYKQELPGLDRAPYPGPKGEDIFANVSRQAWDEWQKHQTCLLYTSFPRPAELGAHAGIAGLQADCIECREIAGDGGGEGRAQLLVDLVVEGFQPAHVRAEAQLPGQIEGGMDAQAGRIGLRHRIDQSGEWRRCV